MEAFAFREFRLYQYARVAAILGAEAQSVAVAWQVYSLTHRALDLGYTGLALFLPGLIFLLPAGHVADKFDRRHIILVCYALQFLCTIALLSIALLHLNNILAIYAVLFLIGTGRAFSGPASSAFLPQIVPPEHFVNAVTWGAATFQFANVTGPALGGILFTLPLITIGAHLQSFGATLAQFEGPPIVYCFTLVTLLWFLLLIGRLNVRPGKLEHRELSIRVLFAGFVYVRRSPILLGSLSLDLFVVLLGGAVALMPIFAHDILKTGPTGLGMLRAAPAVGALAISLLMARYPIRNKAGLRLFLCVALFGGATVLFGLSHSLWLSLATLAIAGAADMVSVIIRGSLIQLATPTHMRGRVSAVNSLFIGASNEFGEFESGVTAQWWGAVRATVIGGIGSLCVAGLWASFFPALRKADALTAEALLTDRHDADDVKVLRSGANE
jgi:MFS family permease